MLCVEHGGFLWYGLFFGASRAILDTIAKEEQEMEKAYPMRSILLGFHREIPDSGT